MHKQGIVVALDEKIEWLLPWWWSRYSSSNHFPVAFIDLGMSHFGRTFCKERGHHIALDLKPSLASLPENAKQRESLFGKALFEKRKSWFKKPFALLSTPFERTLWLDLDCEVLKSLDPLFELESGVHVAAETENAQAREREIGTIFENETLYNSGVIVYEKNAPLIIRWAEAIMDEGEEFWSDQHALSRIIYREHFPIHYLHENFNWRMSQGLNIRAVIIHWVGSWGKEYIRLYGGIADELATLVF